MAPLRRIIAIELTDRRCPPLDLIVNFLIAASLTFVPIRELSVDRATALASMLPERTLRFWAPVKKGAPAVL
jgi:hypothetical protein